MAVHRKYSFTGNVRELENAIEHAFVMCHGDEILVEHLPHHIIVNGNMSKQISRSVQSDKEVIQEALIRHRGNKSKAAVDLGMHRSTLWRKMKTLGIAW